MQQYRNRDGEHAGLLDNDQLAQEDENIGVAGIEPLVLPQGPLPTVIYDDTQDNPQGIRLTEKDVHGINAAKASELCSDFDPDHPEIPESNAQKTRRWLKWIAWKLGWLTLGAFALMQGLGAGANNATAILRALPSLGAVSLGVAQVAVTTLGLAGMFMNFYVMLKLLPRSLAMLRNYGKNFKHEWQHQRGKCIAKMVAIFGSVCTGAAIGVFTAMYAPMTIIGIMSLFGATVFPPLGLIAVGLGIVQGLAMASLLFTEAYSKIDSFSKQKAKNFFKLTWWPKAGDLVEPDGKVKHVKPCRDKEYKIKLDMIKSYKQYIKHKHALTNHDPNKPFANVIKRYHAFQVKQHALKFNKRQEQHNEFSCHCHSLGYRRAVVVGKVVATVLGGLILLGAAIFATVIEGESFLALLKDAPSAVSYAVTGVVVYLSTGILSAILNVSSADSVFGLIGRKIGAGIYHTIDAIKHPGTALAKIGKSIKNGVSEGVQYVKENPGQAAWGVFKAVVLFGWAVVLISSIVGNTAGNAAIKSHGVPGDNSHNATANRVSDSLSATNPQPEVLKDILTQPQHSSMHAGQIAATVVGGAESAAIISHLILHDGEDSDAGTKIHPEAPKTSTEILREFGTFANKRNQRVAAKAAPQSPVAGDAIVAAAL